MPRRTAFCFVAVLFWTQASIALADPFIDDRRPDDPFLQSFGKFNQSLDNMNSTMRANYDYSTLSVAHRNLVQAQANQTDTWKVSQDAFNNTQVQAVNSGGLHNANAASSYGMLSNSSQGGNTSQVSLDAWGGSGPSVSGPSAYGGGNYYGSNGGSGSSAVSGW